MGWSENGKGKAGEGGRNRRPQDCGDGQKHDPSVSHKPNNFKEFIPFKPILKSRVPASVHAFSRGHSLCRSSAGIQMSNWEA